MSFTQKNLIVQYNLSLREPENPWRCLFWVAQDCPQFSEFCMVHFCRASLLESKNGEFCLIFMNHYPKNVSKLPCQIFGPGFLGKPENCSSSCWFTGILKVKRIFYENATRKIVAVWNAKKG